MFIYDLKYLQFTVYEYTQIHTLNRIDFYDKTFRVCAGLLERTRIGRLWIHATVTNKRTSNTMAERFVLPTFKYVSYRRVIDVCNEYDVMLVNSM